MATLAPDQLITRFYDRRVPEAILVISPVRMSKETLRGSAVFHWVRSHDGEHAYSLEELPQGAGSHLPRPLGREELRLQVHTAMKQLGKGYLGLFHKAAANEPTIDPIGQVYFWVDGQGREPAKLPVARESHATRLSVIGIVLGVMGILIMVAIFVYQEFIKGKL